MQSDVLVGGDKFSVKKCLKNEVEKEFMWNVPYVGAIESLICTWDLI